MVHVHIYKLRLEPILWSSRVLTAEALAAWLPGDAMVRDFAPQSLGGHVVSVELRRDRETHEEALNDLLLAAQALGYGFAEAEITKVADRAIEMAVGFGVTGLGAGSTTQNGETALIGAGIGWVVGLFVGSRMEKAEVLYEVQATSRGWHLMSVKPHPAAPARPALGAA